VWCTPPQHPLGSFSSERSFGNNSNFQGPGGEKPPPRLPIEKNPRRKGPHPRGKTEPYSPPFHRERSALRKSLPLLSLPFSGISFYPLASPFFFPRSFFAGPRSLTRPLRLFLFRAGRRCRLPPGLFSARFPLLWSNFPFSPPFSSAFVNTIFRRARLAFSRPPS